MLEKLEAKVKALQEDINKANIFIAQVSKNIDSLNNQKNSHEALIHKINGAIEAYQSVIDEHKKSNEEKGSQ